MGGASCEIDDGTTDVLLEMAWFDPMSIAAASRRLGLRTEASARFEKGCDPDVIELAADRFARAAGRHLRRALADGRGRRRRATCPSRDPVRVRTARVNGMLGTDADP